MGKMRYDYGCVFEGEYGCVYEGEWVTGEANGQGKCTDELNNTFEGYFEKGSPRTGKLFYKNGGYCEGEFRSSSIDYIISLSKSCKLYNGTCNNYMQNNESFTGKILNGKYDEGKLTQSNGGWFEGKWMNGELCNGICENYTQNKENFTGKILNGKYDEGKLTLSNGGWLEGKWVNGMFSDGKCDANIGDSYYQGEWKNGNFYTGKSKGEIKDNYYDGVWINGVFQGRLNYSKSEEGFKTFDGVIDDSGTMDGKVEYADNIIYRGILKNKKKDGNGILYSSKITIEGEWKEDNLIQGKGNYIYKNNIYPFTINKLNDTYNIKDETDNGIITYKQKINPDKHSVFSEIANILSDLRKKQEEKEKKEEKKKEELIELQKDIANAKYYYWTPSEIHRLYEENPAKFDETFYSTILGDGTLIRAKIANIRRETEIGLFGDNIYYNIYLEGGVVIQTYKSSAVSQIRKGQIVFMLAKYQNETTNKYGYTQYPIFRLMNDEFIANSIDAVSKYLKAKRETGKEVYANYYFRNFVRNIYR